MDVIFLKSLRPLYCDYISRILCVRRAQQGRPPRPPFMYFYSRPYARGNLRLPAAGSAVRCNFYSRPYARGDTTLTDFIRNTPLFLLAPLREGRLQLGVEVILHDAISTPAPTRGATRTFAVGLGSSGLNFYSRPYERGDVSERPQQQRHHAISTRAPTRGATAIFHKTIS